jgi:two-component system phosphate regulon sensor histidine kinase PhoR
LERREKVEAVEIGRDLFVQAVVTPFQDKGARGYLVILQDLTAVRRLQTIRRDFVSNISHELRTPLASLRAVVETLQDSALEDPPAAQRFLDRAGQEVDVLTQMVEELLELSRIESGQVPLRLAPTAVTDLVLNPLERLRSQAQRGDVELVLDLPPSLPQVLADAERVQQVITNLLHNAIKFTPSQGKITIRADGPSADQLEEVVISVRDTGIGISQEDVPRIFERFYKSDRARTRSRGGTGLGLAICRHIVQAHNGRIWVKSTEGKGSTFFFSLPVTDT